MKRKINYLLFLRKARMGMQRQGFLLIELVMALFLFVLVVGVAARLAADLVGLSGAQVSRCSLLRLAQTGAESSGVQRQALADKKRGAVVITFNTQRAGQGAVRTVVRTELVRQGVVQLVVVDL